MGDRNVGMTIAFALVSAAALAVAFSAAGRMKRGERETALLKMEVERISQAEKAMRGSLEETEAKYRQEAAARVLLLEEISRSQAGSAQIKGQPQRRTAPSRTAQMEGQEATHHVEASQKVSSPSQDQAAENPATANFSPKVSADPPQN